MIDKESKSDFGTRLKTQFSEQTIIIVTHDESFFDIADSVLTIENGKLQQKDDTENEHG